MTRRCNRWCRRKKYVDAKTVCRCVVGPKQKVAAAAAIRESVDSDHSKKWTHISKGICICLLPLQHFLPLACMRPRPPHALTAGHIGYRTITDSVRLAFITPQFPPDPSSRSLELIDATLINESIFHRFHRAFQWRWATLLHYHRRCFGVGADALFQRDLPMCTCVSVSLCACVRASERERERETESSWMLNGLTDRDERWWNAVKKTFVWFFRWETVADPQETVAAALRLCVCRWFTANWRQKYSEMQFSTYFMLICPLTSEKCHRNMWKAGKTQFSLEGVFKWSSGIRLHYCILYLSFILEFGN